MGQCPGPTEYTGPQTRARTTEYTSQSCFTSGTWFHVQTIENILFCQQCSESTLYFINSLKGIQDWKPTASSPSLYLILAIKEQEKKEEQEQEKEEQKQEKEEQEEAEEKMGKTEKKAVKFLTEKERVLR